MKLGSLFDGIGGFPHSAKKHGITPVWASEIEPWPIRVTQKHFPDMKHLGDITQINGAEIEPVDIITFGSPCQDLSIAGKREGIKGERSGLFSHAIRIIREMRNATNGEYPRFIVWENVPGAFSSNKGQDFRTVLEEITESEISMPISGKWANAGMVRTSRIDLAWRIFDAQYWRVPQRRKRIFLVADFRGQCAGEILFIEESLRGDITESREAREEVAGSVREGIIKSSSVPAIAQCITSRTSCRYDPETETLIPVILFEPRSPDGEPRIHKDICPTLNTAQGGQRQPCIAYGISSYNSNGMKSSNPYSGIYEAETARTLDLNGGNPACNQGGIAIVTAIDCRNLYENKELSATLQSKASGGYSLNYQNPVRIGHIVRRLTPLECLRLQGFPDWWLDIEGMSDTAKYRAIGNSVAIPCVDFIMAGIARVLEGGISMENLKNCPFCGSAYIVYGEVFKNMGTKHDTHYVECRECFAATGLHGSPREAAEAWNKRVQRRYA